MAENRKLIASAAVPVVVVLSYSLVFHVDPFSMLFRLPWFFLPAFFTAYFLSNAVAAVRDSMITGLKYATALKARLLGNAVSLIIPGPLGADLARALVYVNKGLRLEDALSYSFIIAFYDVVVGSFLYLAVLFVRPELLSVFYVLIAIVNILYWLVIMGYMTGTAGSRLNRLEQIVFKRLEEYPEVIHAYQRAKDVIKERLSLKLTAASTGLSAWEYAVQAIPFYFIFKSYLYSLFVNQLYFVSILVPIPSGAVSSEVALTSVLPPVYAIGLRVLELISYATGFVFIREVSLSRLQEEIKRYGKVPQRAHPRGASDPDSGNNKGG